MTMPWRRTLSASSTWHWNHHHHHDHGHHHHHDHHRDHDDMVSDAHLLRGPVNLGLKSVCLGKPEKEFDWILASQQIIQIIQILKSDEQMLQSCGRIGFWQIETRVYEDSKKASTFDDANHHITSQQRPPHHIPSQFIIIIKIIKIIKIIQIIKIIKIIILIYFLAMPSTPDLSPYERLVTAPSTAERPSLKADS